MGKENSENSELERYVEETAQYVGAKINWLLSNQPSNVRYPVDCEAFSVAFQSTDEKGNVTSHHFSICSHPDRGGEQFGCLLTKDSEDGTIKRIYGVECPYQVRKGRTGSAEYKKKIQITEKEDAPF